MTSRVTVLPWIVATTLFLVVCTTALPSQREKRQVTYQADDESGTDEPDDMQLVHPVTKKPLPAQVVYPGDLKNFFTTEAPKESLHLENNASKKGSPFKSNLSNRRQLNDSSRLKRSLFLKNTKENSDSHILKPEKQLKSPYSKIRQLEMSESRLHSSYHKPSVSVMNDIPAEMYFDGAGFLRYEDDSEETSNTRQKPSNYDRPLSRANQDNNKALKEFRQVFNMSHEREPADVKYDDDVRYPDSSVYSRTSQEAIPDHNAQGTQNETPLGMDFMSAYQREMFANMHNNYAQVTQNPNSYQQDPFSFTYPNFYNAQPNFNQLTSPVMQQEPLIQNHRLQTPANMAGATSPTVYASSSSQPVHANSGYVSNLNYQQYTKVQRKKRSVISRKSAGDALASASEPDDHYPYSRLADQQDSSSGFIPITGSFNGGTIQLNFPAIFGANPNYPPRPPMQTYHTYSVPMQPEGRPYRSTMERFYHPSEARRYSYGILGSGNFEVIRGGVFPGERHQGFSGGYTNERVPYNSGYGNYGTTEIILDGPIQGFQGFDNFPAHLINALSKHSELAVHPDRREAKDVAS